MALALLLASLCTAAAQARPSPGEMILIRLRHSSGICAGLCPDFELQVFPEGEVTSHSLHDRESHRFRVSQRELEAFRRMLAPLRPAGESHLDASCPRSRTADGSPDPLDDPWPNDIEIFWSGGYVEAALTSCAFTHPELRRTIEGALRALGADPYSGNRARPGG
jgi:hypothetical protein